MPARRPPSVRARQLAAELRRLRAAATLTGDEVASRLGWSPSKLSRIETGNTVIAADDLRLLLEAYQASGTLHDRLLQLARSASRRGWWDAYDDTLRQGYSTLLALEDVAETEFSYNQMLIPGLLQTEEYARAIIGSTGDLSPGEIDRRVAVRIARQRVLAKAEPLKIVAILDEASLRRIVGNPGILNGQVRHLIDMARQPNVELYVLPFTAGYHPGITSAFKILEFPEEGASDIVFVESMTSDLFIEDERETYRYTLALAELRRMSLDEGESLATLTHITGEIARN